MEHRHDTHRSRSVYEEFQRRFRGGEPIREIAKDMNIPYITCTGWAYRGIAPFAIRRFNVSGEAKRLTATKAYILGAVVGDGCVSTHHQVMIGVTDRDFASRWSDAVNIQYGYKTMNKWRVKDGKRKMYERWVCSREIWEDILSYFPNRPMSENWVVPEQIKTSSECIKSEFLRGLFDAEGSVENEHNTVRLTSINIQGANEVKELLSSLGVESNLYVYQHSQHGYGYAILSIPRKCVRRYAEMVGFSIKRKAARLLKACA